jgi:hypothetical protein
VVRAPAALSRELKKRNTVKIGSEQSPRLIARDRSQNRQESLLCQLFRARGVRQSAAEIAENGLAVTHEEFGKGFFRTALEIQHQLFVSQHGPATRKLSDLTTSQWVDLIITRRRSPPSDATGQIPVGESSNAFLSGNVAKA